MTTGEVAILAGVAVGAAFLLSRQRQQEQALVVGPTQQSLCDKLLTFGAAGAGTYAGGPAGGGAAGTAANLVGCGGLAAAGKAAYGAAQTIGAKAETVAKTGVLLPVTASVYTYRAGKAVADKIGSWL